MDNEVKFVLRTCNGREQWRDELISQIQGLIVVQDKTSNAMQTFLEAMNIVGDCAAIHLEDDIILTSQFLPKIAATIQRIPNTVIQFFSMRSADLTIGSRYEPGRTFMMNQCFYLPIGYSRMIKDYYPIWPNKEKHPTGYDILIADWLKSRKEKYYIYVPSLVQHRQCRSLINSRRSRSRQSLTFEA